MQGPWSSAWFKLRFGSSVKQTRYKIESFNTGRERGRKCTTIVFRISSELDAQEYPPSREDMDVIVPRENSATYVFRLFVHRQHRVLESLALVWVPNGRALGERKNFERTRKQESVHPIMREQSGCTRTNHLWKRSLARYSTKKTGGPAAKTVDPKTAIVPWNWHSTNRVRQCYVEEFANASIYTATYMRFGNTVFVFWRTLAQVPASQYTKGFAGVCELLQAVGYSTTPRADVERICDFSVRRLPLCGALTHTSTSFHGLNWNVCIGYFMWTTLRKASCIQFLKLHQAVVQDVLWKCSDYALSCSYMGRLEQRSIVFWVNFISEALEGCPWNP